MRIVEVQRSLGPGNIVRQASSNAFAPATLKEYHGVGTTVGPWNFGGVREIITYLDASKVPSMLRRVSGLRGDRVRAEVLQKLVVNRDNAVKVLNTVRIDHPCGRLVRSANFFNIHHEKEKDHTVFTGRVEVAAYLPPPFKHIAERYLAGHAERGLTDYIGFVEKKLISSTRVRG